MHGRFMYSNIRKCSVVLFLGVFITLDGRWSKCNDYSAHIHFETLELNCFNLSNNVLTNSTILNSLFQEREFYSSLNKNIIH